MKRSSESIGAIAGALAKAQAEIANPEKSLTATIRSPFPREADRSFRYASLASGLDLVRKSLGRYEIATVQTTSIDDAAGMIRLTTTLAHSSGEWVSSDWPVCQVSETSMPHKMGAALTYARRYALFTLVGIAGDDDLDAPDLDSMVHTDADQSGVADREIPTSSTNASHLSNFSSGRTSVRCASKPVLAVDESASLRDKLLTDLASLLSADEMSSWAHRSMPAKNTLTVGDAQIIEARFRDKLAALDDEQAKDETVDAKNSVAVFEPEAGLASNDSRIDPPRKLRSNRGRVPAKTIRLRDKDHRKFVSLQPCIVCGRTPADAHHLRFAQPRALGRKVSDEFTVPVCRVHHRELHRHGNEASWWKTNNLDPLPIALGLWQHARASRRDLAGGGDSETELAIAPIESEPRSMASTSDLVGGTAESLNSVGRAGR